MKYIASITCLSVGRLRQCNEMKCIEFSRLPTYNNNVTFPVKLIYPRVQPDVADSP